jgi:two-component system, sensor histidine kinase and response regulator
MRTDLEQARADLLEALYDSSGERLFDSVATLAAQITGAPAALVGFLDSDRYWVNGRKGWNVSWLPRQLAFCSVTADSGEILVVPDTLQDPRFASNSLVTSDPHIRFYAGAPVITSGGHAVGTVCVLDRAPRQITAAQRGALSLLAEQVAAIAQARALEAETQRLATSVESLRQQLSEGDERFRDLFEHTDDLIVSIRSDGRILHSNDAFVSALGLGSVREATALAVFDLVTADERSRFRDAFLRIMRSGEAETVETEFMSRTGRRFFVEGGIKPKLVDGKPVLARVIFRDVTARKEVEIQLGKARDAALESSRLKSQFLTNVSHEIRTPMNGVVGMLELLLEGTLNEEQTEFAQTALASADSLLAILNNILHMSKLEAGTLSITTADFDLYRSTERIVEVMKAAAFEKKIAVSFAVDAGVPAVLRGDVGRLRQVLTNLLGNAVKFTDSGSVRLRISVDRETDSHTLVRFSVSDTGIGIPESAFPRLFETFSQADSSMTRRFGGVGLGLATAKQIVELMGGVIGFDSKVGIGSTFWFTIPFLKQKAKETKAEVPLRDARVLVVDQSDTHRRIVSHYLSFLWSMHAEIAEGASEAIEMLRRASREGHPFQVVLFDAHMRAMDGLTFARSVRAESLIGKTGLVMMTALGLQIDESISRAAGISAYLTKPVEQSELFDCMVAALVSEGSKSALIAVADIPARTRSAPVSIPEETVRETRILVAEDNLLNQKLTISQLSKLGFAVDAVANGAEVIDALEKQPYGVILMDCQMPVMDGYEVTKEIRRREGRDRGIKIIAMTAHALEGDREKCLAAGMDDYLSKPTRHDDLATALARCLA